MTSISKSKKSISLKQLKIDTSNQKLLSVDVNYRASLLAFCILSTLNLIK